MANNYDVATADGSLKVTNRDAKYEVTLKANSSTGNVYDGTEKSAKGVVTDRFVIDDVEYAVPATRPRTRPRSPRASTPTTSPATSRSKTPPATT